MHHAMHNYWATRGQAGGICQELTTKCKPFCMQ